MTCIFFLQTLFLLVTPQLVNFYFEKAAQIESLPIAGPFHHQHIVNENCVSVVATLPIFSAHSCSYLPSCEKLHKNETNIAKHWYNDQVYLCYAYENTFFDEPFMIQSVSSVGKVKLPLGPYAYFVNGYDPIFATSHICDPHGYCSMHYSNYIPPHCIDTFEFSDRHITVRSSEVCLYTYNDCKITFYNDTVFLNSIRDSFRVRADEKYDAWVPDTMVAERVVFEQECMSYNLPSISVSSLVINGFSHMLTYIIDLVFLTILPVIKDLINSVIHHIFSHTYSHHIVNFSILLVTTFIIFRDFYMSLFVAGVIVFFYITF